MTKQKELARKYKMTLVNLVSIFLKISQRTLVLNIKCNSYY